MPVITPEQVEQYGKEIVDSLPEEIDFAALVGAVPKAMEVAERIAREVGGSLGKMTQEEKAETGGLLVDYVLANTDTPLLPDVVSDPAFSYAFRAFFGVICRTAKGEYDINRPTPSVTGGPEAPLAETGDFD